jgi:hypothetical protein
MVGPLRDRVGQRIAQSIEGTLDIDVVGPDYRKQTERYQSRYQRIFDHVLSGVVPNQGLEESFHVFPVQSGFGKSLSALYI